MEDFYKKESADRSNDDTDGEVEVNSIKWGPKFYKSDNHPLKLMVQQFLSKCRH